MSIQRVDFKDILSLDVILESNKKYLIVRDINDIFSNNFGINCAILSYKRSLYDEILIRTFDKLKKLEDCKTIEELYLYLRWINIDLYSWKQLYTKHKIYALDLIDLLDSHQEFSLFSCPVYQSDESKMNQINDKLCRWFNENLQMHTVKINDSYQPPKFYFTYRPSSSLLRKL